MTTNEKDTGTYIQHRKGRKTSVMMSSGGGGGDMREGREGGALYCVLNED